MSYNKHYRGEPVRVCDVDGALLLTGTIVRLGSFHAEITDHDGENHDVAYEFIRSANIKKTAAPTVIKEEDKDGKKFVLSKIEDNIDGKISMKYELTVDDQMLWESEEIVTNVYDAENGWSPPDDFDTNKLELIEQMASDGFDMWVQIDPENVSNIFAPTLNPSEEEVPKGKPAFAPGTGPDAGDGGGEDGNAAGELVFDGGEPDIAEPEVGGAAPFAEQPEEGAVPEEGTETPEEAPAEATAASLEEPPTSFARSIVGSVVPTVTATLGEEPPTSFVRNIVGAVVPDDRLHGNPEHRLNPALRAEMRRKGIDSGNTNDLELAKQIREFDYAKPKNASRALTRLEKKAQTL